MRRLAILTSMLVFVLGAGIFIVSALSKRSAPAKSFVVTCKVTRLYVGEPPVTEELQTQFVKSTGEWKVTRYFLREGVSTVSVATQKAMYDVGKNSLNFVSSCGLANWFEAYRSAEFHRSHPEFTRTDKVAGLTTYVHRASNSSGVWVENYYAAETGITPLKTVMHSEDGSDLIIEAISVQFREVSDSEVSPPDLPISFDEAERLIEQNRANGNSEAADNLSKAISEAKQRGTVQK